MEKMYGAAYLMDTFEWSRTTFHERRKEPDFPVPYMDGNRPKWTESQLEEIRASMPRQRFAKFCGDPSTADAEPENATA